MAEGDTKRVKYLKDISGGPCPGKAGKIVDLPENWADEMIAAGKAVEPTSSDVRTATTGESRRRATTRQKTREATDDRTDL